MICCAAHRDLAAFSYLPRLLVSIPECLFRSIQFSVLSGRMLEQEMWIRLFGPPEDSQNLVYLTLKICYRFSKFGFSKLNLSTGGDVDRIRYLNSTCGSIFNTSIRSPMLAVFAVDVPDTLCSAT